MTTEQILREQVKELEKLLALKEARIIELERQANPFQMPFPPKFWYQVTCSDNASNNLTYKNIENSSNPPICSDR